MTIDAMQAEQRCSSVISPLKFAATLDFDVLMMPWYGYASAVAVARLGLDLLKMHFLIRRKSAMPPWVNRGRRLPTIVAGDSASQLCFTE